MGQTHQHQWCCDGRHLLALRELSRGLKIDQSTSGEYMAKPMVHAQSSARKFGGEPEDYLPIHQFMDSSKSVIADNRHRTLTHNSWFIGTDGPLEKAFGVVITNSDGREVSVRTIGEQHCLEDFGGYIPSASDFLNELQMQMWMNNGRGKPPPSIQNLNSDQRNDTD